MGNEFYNSTPQWIIEESERDEREKLTAAAKLNEDTTAELTIKAEMPEFWQRLLKELQLSLDGLAKNFPISGSLLNRPSDFENHCRISLQFIGLVVRQTYTDLFHLTASTTIRCHTLGGKAFQLYFSLRPDGRGVGLISGNMMFDLMSPERTAEYLLRPMKEWVCGKSPSMY
jgi:hypothetical protein